MTSAPTHETLEDALATIERDADAALRALTVAAREAKRLKAAAATGQLRDVQQAVEAVDRLAAAAASTASELRSSWRFDVPGYLETGEYTKELLAALSDGGVRAVESDQRILCYPSIVQVSAADATVVIDKKKERRIRPSVLVRHLADLQDRPPKFKPEGFLETLATAYRLVTTRPGAVATLARVYSVLTLLPGAGRDYTKPEFARDLYLSLPASALTRGSGVLTTVTRSGRVKVYAGIAFNEPGRA